MTCATVTGSGPPLTKYNPNQARRGERHALEGQLFDRGKGGPEDTDWTHAHEDGQKRGQEEEGEKAFGG